MLAELNYLLASREYSDDDLEDHSSRIAKRLELEVEHIGTSKRSTENEHCYMAAIYDDVLNPITDNKYEVTQRIDNSIFNLEEWQSKLSGL